MPKRKTKEENTDKQPPKKKTKEKIKSKEDSGKSTRRRKQDSSPSSSTSDVVDEKLSKPGVKMAAARSVSSKARKYVGAHVSISGGLYKAVLEAVDLNAKAFGMFLKSQRQWASKPLEDVAAQKFRDACLEHGFAPHLIVPHGSYLMNCGSPNKETLRKSRAMLVDELQRCEKLGLSLFNFHPGSTCGEISVDECLDLIAESINQAHKKTKYVIAVIENMSCQGNTVGGKFTELRGIIDRVKCKARIGVCLDTCHAFAAGYNIKTEEGYESMMSEFQRVVGLKYLKAVHVNDSKGPLGCHLDRHENIGKGKIGLQAFSRFMNDSRFDNIPFVLETPEIDYSIEIKKLYSLCGK